MLSVQQSIDAASSAGLVGGSNGVAGRYLATANVTVAGEYDVDVSVGGASPSTGAYRMLVLPSLAHPAGTALGGFNSTPSVDVREALRAARLALDGQGRRSGSEASDLVASASVGWSAIRLNESDPLSIIPPSLGADARADSVLAGAAGSGDSGA